MVVSYTVDGKSLRMIGTHADITERKRVETELLQHRLHLERLVEERTTDLSIAKERADTANNAKSRFLAAASHDLRQPLSALSLYVGLLKSHVMPTGQPMLANMKDCIGSLSELLTDLLDLSKLDAGVVVPNQRDFQIAEVLAQLASVHGREGAVKGLRLRCLPTKLTARTDAVLFKRLLGNLMANAIRYTERGGVLVACRRRRGKTWVEVWDTGIGIPADKMTAVFEEFKQLDDGARNRGSGLGLAIVAKTAALLGLEIRVGSRLGRGSLFAVELPLGQSAAPAMPASVRPAAMRRSLRVALVDDNPMVREALAEGLQSLGHQVVASASKTELLAELGKVQPDVVVSDYRLTQGETGFDVIAAVRARLGAELPAILITGDTDPKLLRSLTERGIIVLHKPLELETLQTCFEDLTDQPAQVM
jgi:signal transduction histidine kinase/CheY-like chemotaxis protein